MSEFFEQIIPKNNQKDFFKSEKEQETFCLHDLESLTQNFRQINFLNSLEDLKKNWKLEVDVHLKGSRDEQTTKTVSSTKQAFEEFKEGQSILFNDVNRQGPELEKWLEEIKEKLKLSSHTFSRCLVYATPKGGGNASHFDQNINFVIQLSGEKTWWTAPNTSVSNPMHRHVLNQPIDPELEGYLKKDIPINFPENSQKFDLKPGSLLYVPPGVWHKTTASSDAVSLNFTFSVPTLSDLILIALRGRLMGSEVWREHARDLKNPDQIEKIDFLIQHLASDMQTWSAEELLSALEN